MSIRDWRWTQWMLAIGILLILVLIGLTVYVLLTPTAFVPPVTQVPQGPATGLPEIIPGGPEFPAPGQVFIPLTQNQGLNTQPGIDLIARGNETLVTELLSVPVNFISLGPAGNELNFYDPQNRQFFRLTEDGELYQPTNQRFADVQNVTYAGNGNDAILEFPDGSNIAFNFDTEEQVTLPQHWQDFDFSPESQSIAFKSLALDPQERWLATSEKNGSGARKVAFLGDNEDIVNVDWAPNNQILATYSRPAGLTRSELFFVGFNDENFPLSRVEGINVEGSWSPAGNQYLYSSAQQQNNFNPSLWLVDGGGQRLGQNRRAINLNTWTHKCAFASNSLAFCGVPTSLPTGSGLIPKLADSINDNLFKVDLTTGVTSRVAIPSEAINVEQITVSEDGSQVFILDRFTKRVKKISVE